MNAEALAISSDLGIETLRKARIASSLTGEQPFLKL
jgi:hypothetical protein